LTQKNSDQVWHPRKLFLFNDILLCTKASSVQSLWKHQGENRRSSNAKQQHFTVLFQVPLYGVTEESVDDGPDCFGFSCSEGKFVCKFDDQDLKEKWRSMLFRLAHEEYQQQILKEARSPRAFHQSLLHAPEKHPNTHSADIPRLDSTKSKDHKLNFTLKSPRKINGIISRTVQRSNSAEAKSDQHITKKTKDESPKRVNRGSGSRIMYKSLSKHHMRSSLDPEAPQNCPNLARRKRSLSTSLDSTPTSARRPEGPQRVRSQQISCVLPLVLQDLQLYHSSTNSVQI